MKSNKQIKRNVGGKATGKSSKGAHEFPSTARRTTQRVKARSPRARVVGPLRQPIPPGSSSRDSHVVKYHYVLGDVIVLDGETDACVYKSFTLANIGPALPMLNNFERVACVDASVTFRPYNGTSVPGVVVTAWDYDASSKQPTDYATCLFRQHRSEGQLWQELAPCKWRPERTDVIPTSMTASSFLLGDPTGTHHHRIYCAVAGAQLAQGDTPVGFLIVDVILRFENMVFPDPAGHMDRTLPEPRPRAPPPPGAPLQ